MRWLGIPCWPLEYMASLTWWLSSHCQVSAGPKPTKVIEQESDDAETHAKKSAIAPAQELCPRDERRGEKILRL